ncbi:MAG: RNase adapter RapZ [Clostridiales bacterium]
MKAEKDQNPEKNLDVWIITGLSGAGKTNAIRIFEDWGYFCIDNLPPSLLAETVAMIEEAGDIQRLALGVDVRSRGFFDSLMPALEAMEAINGKPNILFLDADTPTLVKRFKETRRRHPMASEGMLIEDIQSERYRLEAMRGKADVIIDTSNLRPKDLKEVLERRIYSGRRENQFKVHILSFGFKYGAPWDADLVMDVRFLPNPHYIPELRPFTGLDGPVRDYVMEHEVSQVFFQQFSQLLIYLIPKYIEEGKTNLVVAIGCTGGQHRSVTLAEKLYTAVKEAGYDAGVRHRDIERRKES